MNPVYNVSNLLAESEAELRMHRPEDITDKDGNVEIVLDPIVPRAHTAEDIVQAIEDLAGSAEDCCEACRAAGKLSPDCDWLVETLDVVAERLQGQIQNEMAVIAPDSPIRFLFRWHNGGFYLTAFINAQNVAEFLRAEGIG